MKRSSGLLSVCLSVPRQISKTNAGDTQSRILYKKLAQVSCTINLHQVLMQDSCTRKTCTRKHDTVKFLVQVNLYKFLVQILDCVSPA